MSSLAIAHLFQVLKNWSFTYPRSKQRYCPVFKTRGHQAQYLNRHQSQTALVVKNDTINKLGVSTEEERKDLIGYIRDAIPGLREEEAAQAVAFHKLTNKDLPWCDFMIGDMLKWNDTYLPRTHPARLYCGEGPFKVVREETYLVEIKVRNDQHGKAGVKVGNNRLVLMNLHDERLIVAHGGLFILAEG